MDCCSWRDVYERGPERGRRTAGVGVPRSIQSRYASLEISAGVGAMGIAFGVRERLDRPVPDPSGEEEAAPGNGSSVPMMSEETARVVPTTTPTQKIVPTRPAQRGNVTLGGRARRYYRVSITENTLGTLRGSVQALHHRGEHPCRLDQVPDRCSPAYTSGDGALSRSGPRLPSGGRTRRPRSSPGRARRLDQRWVRGCRAFAPRW